MSMMQRLKLCKIMKKLRNGLRKRNRFHYLLGLRNESQRETNASNLLEWYEKLPENAKLYIKQLEKFVGAKISSISTSPERDDTILVENPFEI